MKVITRDEAVRMIHAAGSRTFGCSFIKRTDGTLRHGNFRLGETVQKGTVGGPPAYDPAEKNLIWVYRMAGDLSSTDGKRRSIAIEGLQTLTIGGETFKVKK